MEDRNYTITIKAEGLTKTKKAVAGDNNTSDTQKQKESVTGNKTIGTMVAYRALKSFATQVINHEVSMVQLRTGSSELQDRANFINDMNQKGAGILEGAIMGAMVGNLPGFLLGTTLSLGHTILSYAQKIDRMKVENTIENQSIQMNTIRAGANGSRRN